MSRTPPLDPDSVAFDANSVNEYCTESFDLIERCHGNLVWTFQSETERMTDIARTLTKFRTAKKFKATTDTLKHARVNDAQTVRDFCSALNISIPNEQKKISFNMWSTNKKKFADGINVALKNGGLIIRDHVACSIFNPMGEHRDLTYYGTTLCSSITDCYLGEFPRAKKARNDARTKMDDYDHRQFLRSPAWTNFWFKTGAPGFAVAKKWLKARNNHTEIEGIVTALPVYEMFEAYIATYNVNQTSEDHKTTHKLFKTKLYPKIQACTFEDVRGRFENTTLFVEMINMKTFDDRKPVKVSKSKSIKSKKSKLKKIQVTDPDGNVVTDLDVNQ